MDGLVALAMAIGLYNRELAPIEYDFDRALILKKELLGAMSMDVAVDAAMDDLFLERAIEPLGDAVGLGLFDGSGW